MITGGASGIGAATVERFLEEGARVAVIDSDEAGGRALRQRHPSLAGVIQVDVADAAAVDGAFRELDGLLGGVDVAINNAGISMRHDFMDITPAEWRKVMSVDLDGVFYVAQQSAKRMLAGTGGVIINMGSTSGMNGYPRYADYNAAKAGVIELTRTMALELAPTIRVIAVCPGLRLDGHAGSRVHAGDEGGGGRQDSARAATRPPSEIAALFAFLASDEAPYITGHPVIIDGGEIAGGLASR